MCIRDSLYCLVGGLTTAVNYVVYFLFTRLVGGEGSSPGLAALIMDDSFQNVGLIVAGTLVAWLAAVAFAFYPNKRWVFKSKGGNVRRELAQFLSARVISPVSYTHLDVYKRQPSLSCARAWERQASHTQSSMVSA